MKAATQSQPVRPFAVAKSWYLYSIVVLYLFGAFSFGSMNLDVDEFSFIREPYELLGGDYTTGYLAERQYIPAIRCMLKSYYLYWNYRPLGSPVIADEHKRLFNEEEEKFGYVKKEVKDPSDQTLDHYRRRLIVPEPDRFYSHGAGKPLLPALLSIPQLAVVKLWTSNGPDLLKLQYEYSYHPMFILVRFIQILFGLLSIMIVHYILDRELGYNKALLGTAIFAIFPVTIKFFPNIHHDSIMIPFAILAAYLFLKERFALAGASFGLALASKNVAIFLYAALLIHIAVEGMRLHANDSLMETKKYLKNQLIGLSVFSCAALLLLIPFANPVSMGKEIISPVIHREHDERSRGFSVIERVERTELGKVSEGYTTKRPEIMLIKRALLFDYSFLFFVPAVFLIYRNVRTKYALYSFFVLLLSYPYGIVFEPFLDCYRSLLFLPFFSILCVDLLNERYLKFVLLGVVMISMIYLLDPISTSNGHPDLQGNYYRDLLQSIKF